MKPPHIQTVSQGTSRKRSYLDPIHQDIILDRDDPAEALIIDLIDCPEFQRLRRIHQLGVSFFTFQGAESSRFTHSVGVMHIASRLANILSDRAPSVKNERSVILASALLHDIGHGPYSHVTEKIIGYDHEDWSCRIISGDTQVNAVLKKHDRELPAKITQVLKKTYKLHYISDIVSSQVDCDRFDYLLRDSHQTGTEYGLFALQRILTSMELDEANDRIVIVGDKGQLAVEDYLFARYSMYAQVYYHRKNLAAKTHLARIIRRARELGAKLSFIDEQTSRFMSGEDLSVLEYLYLDDVQMTYHIKRWAEDPDPVLSDLSQRFLNRKLFHTAKLNKLTKKELAEVEQAAREALAKLGFDPEYYIGIEHTGLRPYDYYQPDKAHSQKNIMIRSEDGSVCELSTISPTVQALVKGSFDTSWLCYAPEARERIVAILGKLPSR